MYKISEERTTASVYHLLKGKRSSQTIQDANIYQLSSYFGILKHLNRSVFEQAIVALKEKELLTIKENNIAVPTIKGVRYLVSHKNQFPIGFFNGMEFSSEIDAFYTKLQLAIQTYSNVANDNHQFIPITDDRLIQEFVKKHYHYHISNLDGWLYDVYQELLRFLDQLPSEQAQLFVDRLSGYNKIGLSLNQLAYKNSMSTTDVSLNLTCILHQLYAYLKTESNRTLQLSRFVSANRQTLVITQSAQQTNQWLLKGFSIAQIAKIRKLKLSTIEDHIIEIAYADPQFNLSLFIDDPTYDTISTAIKQTNTTKLKEIKEMLNDKYNYFQIRLVLAYVKDRKRSIK
ncbi:helix-turn-helix domain-containing protein [Paraliobacillus sp. JSM ZJ581]|uniref:helix-turn-helix domain-containing protein n=1 Tax=Paraliobacillus sp. JSM ZJ581 TaxID=3342118 RepID=UPI0035A93A64